MTRRMFAIALACAILGAGTMTGAQGAGVTGTWVFDVQTDQGSGSPTFVFKQDGEKLTGKYKGTFGEADVAGTVKGNAIKFAFKADAQGQAIEITYEGTIEKDTMKGKLDIAGLGSGTFTAKRQ